jgi:hypothetical protein
MAIRFPVRVNGNETGKLSGREDMLGRMEADVEMEGDR